MKNQISVFIGSDEFSCIEYYDADACMSGVEIFEAMEHKYLGKIDGLTVPDIDDEDSTIIFNAEVENYLNENYF